MLIIRDKQRIYYKCKVFNFLFSLILVSFYFSFILV